jgi:hypothetical protein
MGYRVQRLGFRLSRGWTLLVLVIGLLIGATFWIGPLRPLPAELELVAIQGDDVIDAAGVFAARGQFTAERTARFAVPIAVRNIGARPARPHTLVLSVPARYHLSTPRGRLRGAVDAGVPLRRYTINLPVTRIDPGRPPAPLPGLDTILLEPDLPAYYCILQSGVPEFVPAPRHDAASLADVRIFYSFNTVRAADRHSGLLNVRVDPAMISSRPAPAPPTFRTVFTGPGAELPVLGRMRHVGTRRAHCGDPEQAIELYTVISETQDGGRFYAIYIDDSQRKHLYDLNGDGIIELETWDADGDGRFEARRQARYPVPEFVTPLPPRDPTMLQPDTAPPARDFIALFGSRADGPWRFGRRQRADSIAEAEAQAAAIARAAADAAAEDVPEPDSVWLARFADTGAGPFRFSRSVTRPAPADTTDTTDAAQPAVPTAPAEAPAAAPAAPAPDEAAAVEDRPRQDTVSPRPRREPLGTPVRLPPRRDTIPR